MNNPTERHKGKLAIQKVQGPCGFQPLPGLRPGGLAISNSKSGVEASGCSVSSAVLAGFIDQMTLNYEKR